VGATAEVPTNVRLVSATHKDLARGVAEGRFRQDLFYRLNVIRIVVPPLRERMEDLQAICDALLARIAHEAGVVPAPVLDDEARARLAGYAFPGNVRELENLLHRALAMATEDAITAADLGLPDELLEHPMLEADSRSAPLEPAAAPAAPAGEPLPADLAEYLDEVERRILERALRQHGFNRTAAGARLSLSLRQIRYRMARLGISEGGQGPDAA
jgi:two-component system response regulator PilR (NtrC family)